MLTRPVLSRFSLNKNSNKGFTLVELAIVITIIGILIGGVLKGQQLIDQARLAGTISQLRGYETAVRIFRTKYDGLPGDLANAENRIMNCTGCTADDTNPTGDDDVGDVSSFDTAQVGKTLEPVLFWTHLLKAELITGVTDAALTTDPVAWGATHPAAKIGGGFHGKSGDGGGDGSWAGGRHPNGLALLLVGQVNGYPGNTSSSSHSGHILTPGQAASIDRKLDDGKGKTGSVLAHGRVTICGDGGENGGEYIESSASALCGIAYVIE